MNKTTITVASLCLCTVSTGLFAASGSEAFPTKPIRLIVPFAPGGGFEVVRVVLQAVTADTGQQIVMDNRGGAGGLIAAELAAKANPDGYTVFLGGSASHAILPNLYKKLPYDPVKDFLPVTLLATTPYVLVVNPALAVHSVKEMIALARAKPGQLRYSSSGNGSTMNIAGELFKSITSVDITHVPYKGGGPAMVAVLGGEVQMTFIPPSVVRPHIQSGRLMALGVTSLSRSKVFPDIPTIAEGGVSGFEVTAWYGLLAPTGTPGNAIAWLNREFNKALGASAVKQSFDNVAIDIAGTSPKQFGEFIRSELDKWKKIVKLTGAQVN